MRVLAACEESQAVTLAFRELGHEAYSCDIEPCSGGHPEWHLHCDALEVLKLKWDMIIAFPPCTYLSNAGARHLWKNHTLNEERYRKGLEAKEFFSALSECRLSADCRGKPSIQPDIRHAGAHAGNTAVAVWASGAEKDKTVAERAACSSPNKNCGI